METVTPHLVRRRREMMQFGNLVLDPRDVIAIDNAAPGGFKCIVFENGARAYAHDSDAADLLYHFIPPKPQVHEEPEDPRETSEPTKRDAG